MDGCIGVFEVVKFHTKRHRANKARFSRAEKQADWVQKPEHFLAFCIKSLKKMNGLKNNSFLQQESLPA